VWACPVCAAKIAAERASELGAVLAWAVEQGHTVAMATFTMQHHAGQSLADCWDALTTAWSGRVTAGAGWASESEDDYQDRLARFDARLARPLKRRVDKTTGKVESDRAYDRRSTKRENKLLARYPQRRLGLAERFGVLGWARAVEVLHGPNGWHPHVHAILILDGPASDERVRLLGEAMYDRWQRGLEARGFTAIRDAGGLDIRRAYNEHDLAAYVAKQLALEATHGHAKTGRNGSQLRAPFQVLADVTATGDADDLTIWHEWERASKGHRQLTWSEGIRQLAGLAAKERTDEDIADDDLGSDDLILIDHDAWRTIAPVQADLLEAVARDGVIAATRWLDKFRLTYEITRAGKSALEKSRFDVKPQCPGSPGRHDE
jgi:hypothetical protein